MHMSKSVCVTMLVHVLEYSGDNLGYLTRSEVQHWYCYHP